jgi:hypothetical protein
MACGTEAPGGPLYLYCRPYGSVTEIAMVIPKEYHDMSLLTAEDSHCGCCVLIGNERMSIMFLWPVLGGLGDMNGTTINSLLNGEKSLDSRLPGTLFSVGEIVNIGDQKAKIIAKDSEGFVVEYYTPIGKHSYDGAGKELSCDIVPHESLKKVEK